MMLRLTRRRILFAGLGLGLLVLAAPVAHYYVSALARGEHVYLLRPTSHWKLAIYERYRLKTSWSAPWVDRCLMRAGAVAGAGDVPAVLEAGPAARAVLRDLMRDEDPRIRLACYLGSSGRGRAEVLSLLCEFATSGDRSERIEALAVLGGLGLRARAAIPTLVGALRDRDGEARELADRALRQVDPESARAVGVPGKSEP